MYLSIVSSYMCIYIYTYYVIIYIYKYIWVEVTCLLAYACLVPDSDGSTRLWACCQALTGGTPSASRPLPRCGVSKSGNQDLPQDLQYGVRRASLKLFTTLVSPKSPRKNQMNQETGRLLERHMSRCQPYESVPAIRNSMELEVERLWAKKLQVCQGTGEPVVCGMLVAC